MLLMLMLRRLAVLLLAAAVIAGGITTCPCITTACTIAMGRQMDCCNDARRDGIGAAKCCPGGTQLSQQTASPAADPPARTMLALAVRSVAVAGSMPAPLRGVTARAIDPGAAPPGGSLIAQHTSLLV
jgi:hypothetical protein